MKAWEDWRGGCHRLLTMRVFWTWSSLLIRCHWHRRTQHSSWPGDKLDVVTLLFGDETLKSSFQWNFSTAQYINSIIIHDFKRGQSSNTQASVPVIAMGLMVWLKDVGTRHTVWNATTYVDTVDPLSCHVVDGEYLQ